MPSCHFPHIVSLLTRSAAPILAITRLFSIAADWLSACTLSRRRRSSKEDTMTAFKLIRLAMVVAAATLLSSRAVSQTSPKRLIVVSLEDRKLALVEDR